MEGLALFLGIICSLQIGWNGVVGAATVRVSGDLERKPGQPASLDCFGSEKSLSFYIPNRPSWSYVNKDNRVIPITEGFYCVDGITCRNGRYSINSRSVDTEFLFILKVTGCCGGEAGKVCVINNGVHPYQNPNTPDLTLRMSWYRKVPIGWQPLTKGFIPHEDVKDMFDEGRYEFVVSDENGYMFGVTIPAVTPADDGYYKCSLIDKFENVTDSKVLKLTVLHRVQTLKLEILDVAGARSSTPLTVGDRSIRVSPGPHQVRCTASGSNPSPRMELKYNEDMPNVTNLITSVRDPSGERVKYTTSFTKEVTFSASAGLDQTLTCAAIIANKTDPTIIYFPTKTAGIKLTVAVERPNFACANMSARVGDNYRKLLCNLTAAEGTPVDSLMCSKVHWMAGMDLAMIPNIEVPNVNGSYKVKDNVLDILEMGCQAMKNGLQTTLTFYKVMDVHFDTDYYVQYGSGEGAHRHPAELRQSPASGAAGGAAILTPLSLLLCAASILVRHLARL